MQNSTERVDGLAEILKVAKALEKGDFRQRVSARPAGVLGEVAEALNAHCGMLETFKSECVRILDEMGVIGRLGGQAEVHGLRGSWHGMVSSLNHMACGLTEQIRDVSSAAERVSQGDFSRKVTANACQGEYALLAERMNSVIDRMRSEAVEMGAESVV
jgi:HAMP domain-containing protein